VPRGGGPADKGLLVESVPRRMRVGVSAAAEVRIARDRIDGLVAALNGRGPAPVTQPPLMRALSVRLKAPRGDFWIEPATPETQWVDSSSGTIHDDYAIWRWTVAARRRGRRRLTLMVSARTVGRDGLAVESTPPDRVIEVKVGGNYRRAAVRWVGWIAALAAGAGLGIYWEQIWAIAVLAIGMALGG
jgi:neural Wiskott-Aldrich syndrome protein